MVAYGNSTTINVNSTSVQITRTYCYNFCPFPSLLSSNFLVLLKRCFAKFTDKFSSLLFSFLFSLRFCKGKTQRKKERRRTFAVFSLLLLLLLLFLLFPQYPEYIFNTCHRISCPESVSVRKLQSLFVLHFSQKDMDLFQCFCFDIGSFPVLGRTN